MNRRQIIPGESPAAKRERRPYSRPRVLSRERLEAIAAICSPPGKADPGSCPSGPIGS